MRLASLDVSAVRNLKKVSLQPGAGINLFFGENGAGKTSLLEAIAVLSTGKSFRAGKTTTVISSGCESLIVSAGVQKTDSGGTCRVGIQKYKDETRARIDGTDIKRLSELAATLPCVIITTSNHELIEGGPTERRSFLDWLLFHVEPEFLDLSHRYRSALKQRNAALRISASDQLVSSWHGELAETGELIDAGRRRMLIMLQKHLDLSGWDESLKPTFSYRSGWPEDLTLGDALARLEPCRRRTITTVGPHRGDLQIKLGGEDAKYVYSRGQQKLLAVLMRLAQVEIFQKKHQQPPIVLFDDLPSELDQAARLKVFEFLDSRSVQVFLTSVDDVSKEIHNVSNLFHVKQGAIEKVLY